MASLDLKLVVLPHPTVEFTVGQGAYDHILRKSQKLSHIGPISRLLMLLHQGCLVLRKDECSDFFISTAGEDELNIPARDELYILDHTRMSFSALEDGPTGHDLYIANIILFIIGCGEKSIWHFFEIFHFRYISAHLRYFDHFERIQINLDQILLGGGGKYYIHGLDVRMAAACYSLA